MFYLSYDFSKLLIYFSLIYYCRRKCFCNIVNFGAKRFCLFLIKNKEIYHKTNTKYMYLQLSL